MSNRTKESDRGTGYNQEIPIIGAKNFKGTLKRLMAYLKPYMIQLLAVFAAAVLSTVFSIASPKMLGEVTTTLFKGAMTPSTSIDFRHISQILLLLAGLYAVSAFFSYIQQYIMSRIAYKTIFDIRNNVSDKLTRLPLKFFDSNAHGDIMSRVANDIDVIGDTLQRSLIQFITLTVTIIGTVIMMLIISPWMTLISLITLPFSSILTMKFANRFNKHFASQQNKLGKLSSHIEEMYTGHKVVKALGYEEESIKKFDNINEELYEAGWKAEFISGITTPLIGFISSIGYAIICVVGGIFVMQQRLEVGYIQAFLHYSAQFTWMIAQFASIANAAQSTIASAKRVFELIDEVEEVPENGDERIIWQPKGEVRFMNVRFGYKEDVTLMENMNINVSQGQTIAIVGPTGSGKTTLVNLLMRFYEIWGGKITIDGVDIRDLKRGTLRSMFGMVLQDTWLFNGTIRDNIAYGSEYAADEEVVCAAKAAHADHFIRTLPDGYDTLLNEDASNISQGQKQLLTIARAVLSDPEILILDEATSSVDTRTEIYIQKAMTELMKGRTCFVIAHRLSTIRDADLILVMDKGSIIEQGSHDELLAKGGFYTDLYNSQFKGTSHECEAV